jgi:flavin reductase (DIM6/NTAB) family NADH-FMN oxidoreductase RutF
MCRIIKSHIDSTNLRKTLSTYPTGVSVVTATGLDKQPRGMTINSLVSISLDPPLLGWCLDLNAAGFADFAHCRFFSLSVLSLRQAALAIRFATRGLDKFSGLDCRPGPEGGEDAPLLIADACAWISCKLYRFVPLGDHLMLVGEVLHVEMGDAEPLVFAAGRFTRLDAEQQVA